MFTNRLLSEASLYWQRELHQKGPHTCMYAYIHTCIHKQVPARGEFVLAAGATSEGSTYIHV